jgi:hypothetical protein
MPVDIHPEFLQDFHGDQDALGDFMDNLHDDECIMVQKNGKDINALRQIKMHSDRDVDSTAKALAME